MVAGEAKRDVGGSNGAFVAIEDVNGLAPSTCKGTTQVLRGRDAMPGYRDDFVARLYNVAKG